MQKLLKMCIKVECDAFTFVTEVRHRHENWDLDDDEEQEEHKCIILETKRSEIWGENDNSYGRFFCWKRWKLLWRVLFQRVDLNLEEC